MITIIDSFKDNYDFLSNFYPVTINYEGEYYPSVENAYQSQKTADLELRKMFTICTARQAKRLGKNIELTCKYDWEVYKLVLMERLCNQKFMEYKDLQLKLVNTFPALLVEGNTWGDIYWGKCNGIGENHLGIILMRIRNILIKGRIE